MKMTERVDSFDQQPVTETRGQALLRRVRGLFVSREGVVAVASKVNIDESGGGKNQKS